MWGHIGFSLLRSVICLENATSVAGEGEGGGKRAGVLQNNLVLSTESVMLAPVNSFWGSRFDCYPFSELDLG